MLVARQRYLSIDILMALSSTVLLCKNTITKTVNYWTKFSFLFVERTAKRWSFSQLFIHESIGKTYRWIIASTTLTFHSLIDTNYHKIFESTVGATATMFSHRKMQHLSTWNFETYTSNSQSERKLNNSSLFRKICIWFIFHFYPLE